MSSLKVAAIVVTYNRRELLEKTLDALVVQTRPPECIIVIDNACTDDTAQFLAQYQIPAGLPVQLIIKRLQRNTGGAGGFSYGIEMAYALGYDAFWLMDDDTVALRPALNELLTGLERERELSGQYPTFACSLVLWKDGSLCEMNTPEPTWDWPRPWAQRGDWVKIKSCSFVSCLVTRQGVHEVGLPYREYFIWFDDAEYTLRLAKVRPGIFVPSSQVEHFLGQNRGVNWGDVNADNIWKFEYGARNQVSAAISLRNPTIFVTLMENMARQLWRSPVPLKLKLRLAVALIRGAVFRPARRYAKTVR